MAEVQRAPNKRRILGYFTRIYQDVVSGGDLGYTFAKVIGLLIAIGSGLALSPFTPLVPFVWIIIPATIIGGLVLGFFSFKAEYDLNEVEQEKIRIFEALEKDFPLENENEKTNIELLKALLAAHSHCLKAGALPKKSLLRLIEAVTGFKRSDPLFIKNVSDSLNPGKDSGVHEVLNSLTPVVADQTEAPSYKKSGIYRIAKRCVQFAAAVVLRGGTALGVMLGSCIALALIYLTTPVGWPILVVGGVLTILTAISTLVYSRYVAKDYKQNIRLLDQAIAERKTRYELIYKLAKVTKELNVTCGDPNGKEAAEAHSVNGERPQPSLDLAVPRFRMYFSVLANGLFGAMVGAGAGLSITAIFFVVFPSLCAATALAGTVIFGGLTVLGLAIGSVIAISMSCAYFRQAYKANVAEQTKLKEVEILAKSYRKIKMEGLLRENRPKLVSLLLEAYIQDKQHPISPSKRRLILDRIAKFTDIKYDAEYPEYFYSKLSAYLAGATTEAQNQVREFQDCISGAAPVNMDAFSGQHHTGSTLSSVNRFVWNYVAVPGTICGAFSLGFYVFGSSLPPLLPLLILVTVMVGIFAACKWAEHQSKQNIARLNEIEDRLPIIKTIVKRAQRAGGNQDAANLSVFAAGYIPEVPYYGPPLLQSHN